MGLQLGTNCCAGSMHETFSSPDTSPTPVPAINYVATKCPRLNMGASHFLIGLANLMFALALGYNTPVMELLSHTSLSFSILSRLWIILCRNFVALILLWSVYTLLQEIYSRRTNQYNLQNG
jgi:hypothetical protein